MLHFRILHGIPTINPQALKSVLKGSSSSGRLAEARVQILAFRVTRKENIKKYINK